MCSQQLKQHCFDKQTIINNATKYRMFKNRWVMWGRMWSCVIFLLMLNQTLTITLTFPTSPKYIMLALPIVWVWGGLSVWPTSCSEWSVSLSKIFVIPFLGSLCLYISSAFVITKEPDVQTNSIKRKKPMSSITTLVINLTAVDK